MTLSLLMHACASMCKQVSTSGHQQIPDLLPERSRRLISGKGVYDLCSSAACTAGQGLPQHVRNTELVTVGLLMHSVEVSLEHWPEKLVQQCTGGQVACSDANKITLSVCMCANQDYAFTHCQQACLAAGTVGH